MKRCITFALLSLLMPLAASAHERVIPLWPEGVPGAKSIPAERIEADGRIAHVSAPTLTVVAPNIDRANGTAVIVCPGGGYRFLSNAREGVAYAQWLSHHGVTAFILKSRLHDFGHPAPLQDVLRAIRLVRSRANEFGIAPDRIGVIGSSAGGHLAASAGTLFDDAAGRTGAQLDAISARPDFLILLYPVITMEEPWVHAGSREALLGPDATAAQRKAFSLENRVTASTPPTLLIHTQADTSVPVGNSLVFYEALTRAGVPAEMYLFERGAHGMGMNLGNGTASDWPQRAAEWLRDRGLLTRGDHQPN
ncbi:MAG: alpha/beta hydrolase [Opitutaceae bacterium]|nr:alpha/beta hydrolase [Opitutaceae bacterium]